jgi:hypothetical protein
MLHSQILGEAQDDEIWVGELWPPIGKDLDGGSAALSIYRMVGNRDTHIPRVIGNRDTHIPRVIGNRDSHIPRVIGNRDGHIPRVIGGTGIVTFLE